MTVCVLVLVLMLHQNPLLLEYPFSVPISVHNDKLLLSSTDNFCKQVGPRSGTIKRSCQNAACAVPYELSLLYITFFSAPISIHNHLLQASSADNLCKQFGPRSGAQNVLVRMCACAVSY